jgi:16S rRNA processing protein RimM
VTEELLAVGRIARAHGVTGEVAVQSLTEVAERFAPGAVLLLGPDGDRSLTVTTARSHHNRVLVRFEEIGDRTEAETLRGRLLLVPAVNLPAPPDGSFWVHEVVGLDVVTEDGRSLGRISEVQANPANDIWVTDRNNLIPAVRQVVTSVDRQRRLVTIRDMPGLLDED